MSKNTFCILPFVHMQIKPSGQMNPCCRFDFHNEAYKSGEKYVFDPYNVGKKSLRSSQNSELWQDIRQKLVNNEHVAGCHKCYKEEDTSGHSMRTYENSLRNKNNQTELVDKKFENPRIKYLEMTFGNYCNLKCRTCNADLSSTWWEDENFLAELGRFPDRAFYPKTVNIPFNWKKEDFVDVEEIKFTGGEPMIHPDFLKLMDMLIELDVAKNIKLDVFTNCSWIPGEKYLERLRKFKKIVLSLSIDGLGKVNEYIRHPSKWETVDEAVSQWLALEAENRNSIHIVWNPTINIYNVLQLEDMIRWWFEKNRQTSEEWMELTVLLNADNAESEVIPAGKMKLNVLHFPDYLRINHLHPDHRTVIIEKLKTLRIEMFDSKNKIINERIMNDLDKAIKKTIYDSALPTDLKRQMTEHMAKYIVDFKYNKDHWFITELKIKINKIIETLGGDYKKNEELTKRFIDYTNELDKLRNEKLKDCIPELYTCFEKDIGIFNERKSK